MMFIYDLSHNPSTFEKIVFYYFSNALFDKINTILKPYILNIKKH